MRDLDDAYANSPHIPGSDKLPALWAERAAEFRASVQSLLRSDIAYGPRPRNRFDLILPDGDPKGLVVCIHGGYWMRTGKSDWTHLAAGAHRHGWAVVLPGYTLAPNARIRDITLEIAAAVEVAAALVPGPIRLTGHSAGGHLATRMVCDDSTLTDAVQGRIARVLSISGLHDLRPLLSTKMNDTLRLDDEEARLESPALHRPKSAIRLMAWVGAAERPEFIRQSELIANIWTGLGAETAIVTDPDHHHFSVIDGLSEADAPITRALLDLE